MPVFHKLALALLAVHSLASIGAVHAAAPSGAPVIKTTSGTFRGVSSPATGLDTWLGVPYAQPPIGALRFKAPVAITAPPTGAVRDANAVAPFCPQPTDNPVSEDCLYINVYRPSNVSFSTKLPVLFWIHGGAYNTGSPLASADPTGLLARSVAIGKPIMFVSTSYRVNAFGFLASATMDTRDLNAGLQDQRLALEYVQDNIAAFGGDPTKVTIFGQSAGGGGMEAEFLYPSSRSLFRAGIADSSSGPFKTSPPPNVYDRPNGPFTRFLAATNCTSLACLRALPFQTLLTASNGLIQTTLNRQVWQPTVSGDPRSIITKPMTQVVREGSFLKGLPYLCGTNSDEGTSFTSSLLGLNLPRGPAQDARMVQYIKDLFIDPSTLTNATLNEFTRLYQAPIAPASSPLSDSHDSELETTALPSDPIIGPTADDLVNRASAFYTESMFLAPRRLLADRWIQVQKPKTKIFVYSFREVIAGADPMNGVNHASELTLLYGPPPASQTALSNQMRDFYIRFVTDLNPGGSWLPFTGAKNKSVLLLKTGNVTMIDDMFNRDRTDFINSPRVLHEMQK